MMRNDMPAGTDKVLMDPGFTDAEKLSAKALLAARFNDLVNQRGLTQAVVHKALTAAGIGKRSPVFI